MSVYPRTRGATCCSRAFLASLLGLSPHARGNLVRRGVLRQCPRSIPARAGQPLTYEDTASLNTVYPRTRGATMATVWTRQGLEGLSPHARGNRVHPVVYLPLQRVYPRTRGATMALSCSSVSSTGLSPHARGNPHVVHVPLDNRGSIPARAGQPAPPRSVSSRKAVYPRTRGATNVDSPSESSPEGLSPHARGNRGKDSLVVAHLGSIPARAGQPPSPRDSRAWSTVYPRTRGATPVKLCPCGCVQGLSPHARGNLLTIPSGPKLPRSIPARAGQPRREYAGA